MPIELRRTWRLAVAMSLSLVIAYGAGLSNAYIAPILAMMLTLEPAPPMPAAKLLVTVVALTLILSMGLVVAPLVDGYTAVGLLLVGLGLFVSTRLSLASENAALGTLLAIALTLVSAVGVMSLTAARLVVLALVASLVVAVVAQRLAYALFPETDARRAKPTAPESSRSTDARAWRSVGIIMPAYLFLLINPMAHTPVMMKTIALSQSIDTTEARHSAWSLIAATLTGGGIAALWWLLLQTAPTLWFFGLLTLLLTALVARCIYLTPFTLQGTRFAAATFWTDVMVTALVLVGPAVEDTANGKDPWQGFAVRIGFFLMISVYVWGVYRVLERRGSAAPAPLTPNEQPELAK